MLKEKTQILEIEMKNRGISRSDLAKRMGISQKSLDSKIDGKKEFKVFEAKNICNILHIKNASYIFFE